MRQQQADRRPVGLESDPAVEHQPELLRGIWHAPRGPLTRLVAWLILGMIGLAVLVMLWVIVLM